MLDDIRDHVLASAEELAAAGETEALLMLTKALMNELVRVSRVAEQRILTDLLPAETPQE